MYDSSGSSTQCLVSLHLKLFIMITITSVCVHMYMYDFTVSCVIGSHVLAHVWKLEDDFV